MRAPLYSANLPQDVQVTADNRSVTISWTKPETAPRRGAHVVVVVEWYPEGHKLEELRWVRLGPDDNRTVSTGGTCRVTVNTGEITHTQKCCHVGDFLFLYIFSFSSSIMFGCFKMLLSLCRY